MYEKINKVNLSKQIVSALKAKGYEPEGKIAYYSIYSTEKKIIGIPIYNTNAKDKKVIADIEKIVNTTANKNSLGSFKVEIINKEKKRN